MVAAAVAGSAVVGGYLSSSAAKDAANTQADAANSAAQAQLQQFNTINNQQAPYRNAGYGALSSIMQGFGLAPQGGYSSQQLVDTSSGVPAPNQMLYNSDPNYRQAWDAVAAQHQTQFGKGYTDKSDANYIKNAVAGRLGNGSPANTSGIDSGFFTHQFDANDLKNNLAPNYDFMLKQGQGQIGNTLNSTAGLLSGNAQQGLNTFTQNYAKNAYQDAFNNYTTNQNNIYNRLSNLAGLGQTSLQQSSAAGQNAVNAATGYLTSGAAAQAAGRVGSANAISNGLGDIGAYYALSKFGSGSGGNAGNVNNIQVG